jgi:excisionase family DNA binding protein
MIELCTPKELATLLKVPSKTIYYWVSRKEIPYIRVGRHLRFNAEQVLRHFVDNSALPSAYCREWDNLVTNTVSSRSLKSREAGLAYSTKE